VLTVESVQPIGTDTYEVIASPGLRFRPGQWAQISAPTWNPTPEKQGTRRVLSLAGAPGESTRFGFTAAGDISAFKKRLIESDVAGSKLYVDEVGGNFTLPRTLTAPTVLIAGGIGITPFRSMLADLLARGADLSKVSLIYAANGDDRLVYADVLDAVRAAGGTVVTVTGGLVGAGDVAAVAHPGSHYYLSGPPAMLDAIKPMLLRAEPGLRWQPWRLHTDRFIGY
jgi:ferredoxin-NADP reductase